MFNFLKSLKCLKLAKFTCCVITAPVLLFFSKLFLLMLDKTDEFGRVLDIVGAKSEQNKIKENYISSFLILL